MEPVLFKLKDLIEEKNLTVYKTTAQSGLSENTIYNWYNKGAEPSIHALRLICKTLKISMAELFAENSDEIYTLREQNLINSYRKLTEERKVLLEKLAKEMEAEN